MKTIQEALAYETARVGYVYPNDEENYWISSNLQNPIECVDCVDGFYFRETYPE